MEVSQTTLARDREWVSERLRQLRDAEQALDAAEQAL